MRFRAWVLPLALLAAAAWPALTLLGRCLSRPASFDHLDYTLYYAFAVQGLQGGWHRLYDLELQRATFRAISPGLWWFPIVYTPAMAVLMVPFALLPLDVGHRIWSVLLCASYTGCAVALAPGKPLVKAAHVALSLVPYPVALGLGLGQPIALQMAALACAYHLLRRDRDRLAGACLLAVAVKPQCMVLVPFTLLAAGRTRAFASFAIGFALLAIAILALIGLDGASAYLERLRYAAAHREEFWVSWSINLPRHFVTDGGRLLAQCAAAAAAFVAARRHRNSEVAIAAGLVGSLLVTPFLHLEDFMFLFPAAWLTLRRARWSAIPLAGCYLLLLLCTHHGTPIWGRWVLLFECVWLAALAVMPLRWLTGEQSGAQPASVPIVPARL